MRGPDSCVRGEERDRAPELEPAAGLALHGVAELRGRGVVVHAEDVRRARREPEVLDDDIVPVREARLGRVDEDAIVEPEGPIAQCAAGERLRRQET